MVEYKFFPQEIGRIDTAKKNAKIFRCRSQRILKLVSKNFCLNAILFCVAMNELKLDLSDASLSKW